MDHRIVPIAEKHLEGVCAVVYAVARERRYLAMLRGFTLRETRDFVRARMKERSPYFVALAGGRVLPQVRLRARGREAQCLARRRPIL
jgi:hypothetical protein